MAEKFKLPSQRVNHRVFRARTISQEAGLASLPMAMSREWASLTPRLAQIIKKRMGVAVE